MALAEIERQMEGVHEQAGAHGQRGEALCLSRGHIPHSEQYVQQNKGEKRGELLVTGDASFQRGSDMT